MASTPSTEILLIPDDRTPVDLLLFRRLRREADGLVEDTLARNRGLSELGPFPPVHAKITVVIPPDPATLPPTPVISLYD
jgi:phage tail protein X